MLLALPMMLHSGLIPRAVPYKASEREVQCLADNIYHEARGETIKGQIAVAQVTLNRVLHDTHFKSTICGVVYEKSQFSWTDDKSKRIRDSKTWLKTKALAQSILDGYNHIPNFNALYYHANHVKPRWSKTKQIITTIGSHVFYH